MAEFSALMLYEADGKVRARVEKVDETRLPAGEVTVAVEYSSLNYKDGLVLNGLGKLVRNYPHIPGIDFAGTVEDSSVPQYKSGDKVVVTGWRIGEATWGGFAQRARVNASQLVPLPSAISPRQAMAIGTAGFTAMISLMALERQGLAPGAGEVLVTGAAGGVGSVAVMLLARLGHQVVACTGRLETHDYLRNLGAQRILERAALAQPSKRLLDREKWAGAIDTVGGTTLSTLLTQLRYGCSVAACGLAGGNELNATVIPFILRGVSLLGIDSVMAPFETRRIAWDRLAGELPMKLLDGIVEQVPLGAIPELADRIIKGRVRGRVIVDVNA